MYLSQFRFLSRDEKQMLILSDGVYLSRRRTNDHLIFLFALHGFYTEVFFDEAEQEIVYIKCFDDTDRVLIYCDAVNWKALLPDSVHVSI